MEDKDFRKFKKSLDHQRNFDFNQDDWTQISDRLDRIKSTSFLSRFLTWKSIAASAVLFLLLGNLFLWNQLSRNHTTNEMLLTQLLQNQKKDTVVVEKWNTISDTIIKEKHVIQKSFSQPIAYFSYQKPWFLDFSTLVAKENNSNSGTVIDLNTQEKDQNHLASCIPKHLVATFNKINFRHRNQDLVVKTSLLLSLNAGPSRIQKSAYYLRPKGILVGGEFAFNFPFSQSFKQEENIGLGLRIEIPFTNQVSLWTSLSGHFTEFSSDYLLKDFDKDIIEIPLHIEFVELSIIQKYNQFMVGFKYDFLGRKKWKPFLSVGYGVVRKLETDLIYDFVDKNTGLPIQLHKKRPVDDFEMKNLLKLGVGMDYKYNKRLYFQTKIGYMLVGNHENVFYKSGLNIGAGILYHF